MTSEEAIKILCDTVLKRKQHSRLIVREAVTMVDTTPTVTAQKTVATKGKSDASDS